MGLWLILLAMIETIVSRATRHVRKAAARSRNTVNWLFDAFSFGQGVLGCAHWRIGPSTLRPLVVKS